MVKGLPMQVIILVILQLSLAIDAQLTIRIISKVFCKTNSNFSGF